MRDWTIGKRLFTGIGALVLCTAALSWLGLRNAANLDARVALTAGPIAEQIQHSDQTMLLAGGLYENAVEIMVAALRQDKATVDQIRRETDAEVSELESELETLNRVVDSDERQQVIQIRQQLTRWKAALAHVQSSLNAGDVSGAAAVVQQEVKPASYDLERFARTVSGMQYTQMQRIKEEAARSYASEREVTLAGLALALVTGGILIWVVRGINVKLRQTSRELSGGSVQTTHAADQLSTASQSLAQGSSEQAASLEETSASVEQINSMASRNREHSRAASDLMAKSRQGIVDANQALDEMVVAMSEIGASSEKISRVIKIIDEIAFQTNILALNAAVEAARAGDAGLGFAVVADEVRSLAQRCAQAVQDTSALVHESVARSGQGRGKVDRVAAVIRGITEELNRVKVLVDEVDGGSHEQAQGIEQISIAVGRIGQVTQITASHAEQCAAATEELNAQSRAVQAVAERLSLMVDGAGRAI